MLGLKRETSIVQCSIIVAIIASIVGLAVFLLNFYCFNGNMPFYRVFNFPGLMFLKLFSEEIDFWPKLGLLISGQFGAYFLLSLFTFGLKRLFNGKVNPSDKNKI